MHKLIRAGEVQVDDVIVTETVTGVVSMIDEYGLGVIQDKSSSGYWPCLRLFVSDQGGVARFPNEYVTLAYRKGDL